MAYLPRVVRDLRVYALAADGRVLHYRDSSDLEVDAIVETADAETSRQCS